MEFETKLFYAISKHNAMLKVLQEFLKNLESDRNWLFSKFLGQFQELYAHGGNNRDYLPGGKIFTIIIQLTSELRGQ